MNIDPSIIVGLFNVFAPIIAQIIREHSATNGEIPTDEQIIKQFGDHVEEYLAEGAEFKRTHPTK
jgi:hypothetical protein